MNFGIRDNMGRGSVGEFLKKEVKKNSELLFLSAYFTVYAYAELKEQLNNISSMKFLFGEPTFIKENAQNMRSFSINQIDMKDREKNTSDSSVDIRLNDRTKQKQIARECVDWIQKKVEIRSMVKPNFLHGKLYHIKHSNGREISIMGSSNFTYNGLGFGSAKNIELNLITDSNRDIADLRGWFMEIWNDSNLSIDVKEQVINHLKEYYKENSPEFIYYYTLYHIYKDYLLESQDEECFDKTIGFYETKIWNMLYDFQKDAVRGAINKLKKYNGCIIADSVGLGKTFEALAVIKHYEIQRKNVLVLCPKRLGENWEIFRRKNDSCNILKEDNFQFEVLYHTDLGRTKGERGYVKFNSFDWKNFDLIVIDESHNFRNNNYHKGISRYDFLFEKIIKDGRKTHVLMLSATPVNNRLTDLKNQIDLVTENNDNALNEIGIKSIAHTCNEAQKYFNKWSKLDESERKVEILIDYLISTDFFNLLDTLTIARSRSHIKKYFNTDELGGFPKRLKPQSMYCGLDKLKNTVTYKEINDEFEHLNLAIFSPFKYLKDNLYQYYSNIYDTKTRKGHVFKQTDRESHLIGMMRVNYLKRLESSIHSFNLSINRLMDKIKLLINQYDKSMNDSEYDISNIIIDNEDAEELFVGEKVKIALKDIKPEWKEKLEEDLIVLRGIYCKTSLINNQRDEKLTELKKLLYEKVRYSSIKGEVINNGNKKCLIFTAFSDTAEYLYKYLEPYCKNTLSVNIGLVTGSSVCKTTLNTNGKIEFNSILSSFSPVSKGNIKKVEEEIDILIATDCISEGQNLQDCDCVINYDIHWNPVRLLQRFGRIDRISKEERRNSQIKTINFWATKDLDYYIKLNERVKSKMTIVSISSTGGETNIIDESEVSNYTRTFRERQLIKMRDEVVDIEELYENISLTEFNLNDFRMDIVNFLKEKLNYFESLPLGLYAVHKSEKIDNSIIFCLKRKSYINENRKGNILEPYYIVIIGFDGNIIVKHTDPKKSLSLYRDFCYGEVNIHNDVVKKFNAITTDTTDMSLINKLLETCLNEISNTDSLTNLVMNRRSRGRGKKQCPLSRDDFELVSFLVVME